MVTSLFMPTSPTPSLDAIATVAGVEGDGEELLPIAAEAPHEAVAGHQRAERARVHASFIGFRILPPLAANVRE